MVRSQSMNRRVALLPFFLAFSCGGGDETDNPGAGDDTGEGGDGGTDSSTNAGDATSDTPVPMTSEACAVPPGTTSVKLPSAKVDTKLVPGAGKTITVAKGGDLQKAITDAVPGDTISLEAGATFEGNFTLPKKEGDAWIVIRSATDFPEGVRVTPKNAASMAKLQTKSATPVLTTAVGAHHYRLIGLELRPADGVDVNDLVTFGSGSETDVAQQPHHLIVDRSFLHGDPAKGGKRGLQLNSAHTAIIDSWLSDWKRVSQDTQAILGWNGPGPFKIVNNHLEGAGENVMFGGADPQIKDLVPADIEICRNHFYKPLTWKVDDGSYAGTHWSVKNSFELKMARRVLISGNVFEQCWADAQTGFAIVLKTANQDGGSPWAITEDVTFAYNIINKSNNGIAISPRDTMNSEKTRSLRVFGNLLSEIGGAKWGSGGRVFQQVGVDNVSYEHNTGFALSHIIMFDGGTNAGAVFRDNLLTKGEYGVFGSGTGEGKSALDAFAPGAVFEKNAVVGGKESSYPANNFFPATVADVGFTSATDFRLKADSSYAKKASDGTDIGADFAALDKATLGVVVAP